MPRRPTRTVPTVVLHGADGPAAEQWYSWLAAELTSVGREVRVPVLSAEPDLARWLAVLDETLAGLPEEGFDVVCHSLGCLLWLHASAQAHQAAQTHPGAGDADDRPRPARVALASPPSPTIVFENSRSFYPVPLDAEAVRRAAGGTVLVGGDLDASCPEGVGSAFGLPLRLPTTTMPGVGRLDAAAGYGPWPAVLDWCGRDNLAFIA